jgi:hypothetical protein
MNQRWLSRALSLTIMSIAGFVAERAGADAPPGRYVVSTNSVRDTKTGLVWQRNVDAETQNSAGAGSYCVALVIDGEVDWRVPTLEELQSLVDYTRVSPAMDTNAFPAAPPDTFWSSTALAGSMDSSWYVDFKDGAMYGGPASDMRRIRCVR